MEKTFAVVFFTIYLLFVFFIIKGLLLKGILHFRLLKKIYPEKLRDVKSYFQLMWLSHAFKLNFDILVWFWMPFYYSKKTKMGLSEDALELHYRLKHNNKKMVIVLLCFIVYFVIFWIVATKLGT